MYTCKKTYADIPFAHRQHAHDGHCAFIHGHNWSFTFTFGCKKLDATGFVVDFGKLKPIRDWIEDNLDHACLFNQDDPLLDEFLGANDRLGCTVYKAYVIESCSSEGIAKHLYEKMNALIKTMSGDRAFVVSVEVVEDQKNSATYTPR